MEEVTPRVSIVLPVLNGKRWIAETVESVLGQSFPGWELVVQDGGSTDGTLEVLESYADPRIRVFSEPDRGFTDAVTRGLRRARGDYWMVLCASDAYADPDWLLTCVTLLDHDPALALVWGLPQVFFEDGTVGPITRTHELFWHPDAIRQVQRELWLFHWLRTGAGFPDSNMCLRRLVFQSCWPWEHPERCVDPFPVLIQNFTLGGYLPYGVPRVASWVRAQSSHLGVSNFTAIRMLQADLGRIRRRYVRALLEGRASHVFRDGFGRPIATLQSPRETPAVETLLRYALEPGIALPVDHHFSLAAKFLQPVPVLL